MILDTKFIIYGINKTEADLYFPNLYIYIYIYICIFFFFFFFFSNLRVMQVTTCRYTGQGLRSFAHAFNGGTSAHVFKGAVSSSLKLVFYRVLQNEFTKTKKTVS